MVAALGRLDVDVADAELVDRIRVLEEVKAAAASAQARVVTAFAEAQQEAQRRAGVPQRRVGAGIASQVGLARRESPARAQRYLGWARVLCRITVRPAPETMSYLTGYLPVAQGVAVHASLKAWADSRKSRGDERSRGQIMADTLVERVTGRVQAEVVPVEISLVMSDQALFATGAGAAEPAHVEGFGPVPAELARAAGR